MGQRRQLAPFKFSIDPANDHPPTLDDMTYKCARRDPAYAGFVRRVTRRVLRAMGCGEDDVMPRPGSFHGCKWAIGLPGGGSIRFGNNQGRKHVYFELPGKISQAIGTDRMAELMGWVQCMGKATRIDMALDDFDKVITPEEVETL